MTNTNWLARVFDWLGEVFERFNPSAFRFLAAILPYLTPVPVAWLTADSASQFLHFPPEVAFTFVFCLEGIGLWFTALLVDSVVEWVRSKNIKTFAMVILFGIVVIVYVNILVSLNVTLETALGNPDPVLSRVITLLCFLPLLTGVGNGYYKLRLDYKTDAEISRIHQEELERERRREKSNERLEKYKIKYGTSERLTKLPKDLRNNNGSSKTTSGSTSKTGRPSIHQERVFSYLEEQYRMTGEVPKFSDVANDLELPQSTASRLRNEWINTKRR